MSSAVFRPAVHVAALALVAIALVVPSSAEADPVPPGSFEPAACLESQVAAQWRVNGVPSTNGDSLSRGDSTFSSDRPGLHGREHRDQAGRARVAGKRLDRGLLRGEDHGPGLERQPRPHPADHGRARPATEPRELLHPADRRQLRVVPRAGLQRRRLLRVRRGAQRGLRHPGGGRDPQDRPHVRRRRLVRRRRRQRARRDLVRGAGQRRLQAELQAAEGLKGVLRRARGDDQPRRQPDRRAGPEGHGHPQPRQPGARRPADDPQRDVHLRA